MFIKTTTHKRIVAEKDAEIAGLMKRINGLDNQLIGEEMSSQDRLVLINGLHKYIARLRARLAPFTKIRARDSRGRFIKDTVA